MNQSTATLREQAADEERLRQESFDRSDTDGFLSQWAHGLTAQKLRLEADVAEKGGVWEFDALTDAVTGEEVPNRVIKTQYGTCHAVLDANGRFTGTFVPLSFGPRSKHYAAYRIGKVTAPAEVAYGGSGKGLSGAASVYVYVKRVEVRA